MLEVVDGALDAALRGASWGLRGTRSGKHGAFRGVKELRTEEGPEDQECAMLRLYSLYYTRTLGGFFDL